MKISKKGAVKEPKVARRNTVSWWKASNKAAAGKMKNISKELIVSKFNRKIQDPEDFVLISSFGGCGTTFLINFFEKYFNTNHPGNRDGLKHRPYPPKLSFIKKAIYVFGDPVNSVIYHFRKRSEYGIWAYAHCRNMGGDWADLDRSWDLRDFLYNGEDLFKMSGHLSGWLNSKANYPIMFVRYENIWDHLGEIFDFLRLPLSEIDKFPKKITRACDWEKLPPDLKNRALKIYAGLRHDIENLEDVFIKESSIKGLADCSGSNPKHDPESP